MVLKILSREILHKSDAGGVKIDPGIEGEVRKAFDEIVENAKNYSREKGIDVDPSRGVFVSDFARSSHRSSCPTGTRVRRSSLSREDCCPRSFFFLRRYTSMSLI